jgi:hypothetical protein
VYHNTLTGSRSREDKNFAGKRFGEGDGKQNRKVNYHELACGAAA